MSQVSKFENLNTETVIKEFDLGAGEVGDFDSEIMVGDRIGEINENEEEEIEFIELLVDVPKESKKNNKNKKKVLKEENLEDIDTHDKVTNKTKYVSKEKTNQSLEDTSLNEEDSEENIYEIKLKKFREYIKVCNTLGLIPSWSGFEKYYKL